MNEKGSRNSQLSRINEVSFAVDDMLLYLDTHPCDRKALEYCDELVKERRKLLQEYAEKFGPLTIDCTEPAGKCHLEVDGTAVSMGKGRSVQIVYVEL